MSTNISKQKREDLLTKIKEIRTFISAAPQDENTGNLLSYLSELEKDVCGKKYGLVFEEHREEIDEVLATHTPVLTEQSDLYIANGGEMNFLIEGDNLASLQLLEKTHKGKIDLIYIDPPYNTGNQDFIYDDCYVDTEDGFRHSKWISFMTKRLYAARSLLTEKGVIFIQISDIELAQLRLLCDTVFGEDNFLNIISVNMKNIAGASGGGEDKRFKKNCEYILVYAKNYSLMPLFNGPYEYREIYSVVEQYRVEGKNWHYTSVLVERGDKEYFGSTVDGNGDEIKLYRRKNAVVKSVRQVMADEGISEKEVYYKYGQCIFEAKDAQSSIRTRVINAKKQYGITDDIISIEYIPKTGKNKGTLYEQFYKGDKCRLFAWLGDISEIIDGLLYKKDLQGTYWDYTSRINNLTKEGNVEFGNGKKPIDLLKRIIALYPDNEITVLDFFAGSGSTGHAVIAQNIEDGGNRQFILCTNNQNSIQAIVAYAQKELGIGTDKTENRTRLQTAGYELSENIVKHTLSGETATLDFAAADMNAIAVTEKLNTHTHGRDYHQKVGKIGLEIGMEYSYMNTIIRKLFDKNFKYSRKILALEPREVYAFVINNADRLRHLVREAMAYELAQLQLEFQQKSYYEFRIPQACLFTYNGDAKTQLVMKKNVYQNYLSSAAPRSMPEVKFEKYCERSNSVEWWYKNGDKGNEYFSIVYTDNSNRQKLFYPDYIISVNGELWIIETKGGFDRSGNSQDIDLYTPKKFGVLKAYLDEHGLKGGIVRNDATTDELCICMDHYSDDIGSDDWQVLESVLP